MSQAITSNKIYDGITPQEKLYNHLGITFIFQIQTIRLKVAGNAPYKIGKPIPIPNSELDGFGSAINNCHTKYELAQKAR